MGVKVTRWHDEENYECDRCPFKTLDLLAMGEHQVNHNIRQALGVETASVPGVIGSPASNQLPAAPGKRSRVRRE